MDENLLPQGWADKAPRLSSYNLIAPLFALNLNLREPLAYKARPKWPSQQLEEGGSWSSWAWRAGRPVLREIVQHHERGTVPPTVMWGASPTAFDPTQAPQGGHTAFMWEKLPYRLKGDLDHRGTRPRRSMAVRCSSSGRSLPPTSNRP